MLRREDLAIFQHCRNSNLLLLLRTIPSIDAILANRRRYDTVRRAELQIRLERHLLRRIRADKSRSAASEGRQAAPHGHCLRVCRDRDFLAADHAVAARLAVHLARVIELVVRIGERIGIVHMMRTQISPPIAIDRDAVFAGIRVIVIAAHDSQAEVVDRMFLGKVLYLEVVDSIICRAIRLTVIFACGILGLGINRQRTRRDKCRIRHETRCAKVSRGNIPRHSERLRRRVLREGEVVVRVVPGEIVRYGAVLRLLALDEIGVLLVVLRRSLVVLRRSAELDIDRIADIVDRLEVTVHRLDIRLAVLVEILDVQCVVIGLRDLFILQADMQRRGRDRALADEHGIALPVRRRDLVVRIVRAVRVLQRKATVRHSMLPLLHLS